MGMRTRAALLCLIFSLIGQSARAAVYLFDNTKAETAGNADWVLDANSGNVPRFPTPAQSGITASTTEGYWLGALSAWGVELVKRGNLLESLPTSGRITFGDFTNVQDLSHYDVYVVCEPNILFTAAEKIALAQFVLNGGALFLISDHTGSDRNNDGADSVQIWNDFFSNNGVADNAFGLTINSPSDISLTSSTVATSATDPLIHGPEGAVASLKYSNGATMTINPTNNPSIKGAIWSVSSRTNSTVMTAYGSLGQGRFVAIGDSSPEDDGTGDSGDTLFPGWTENGTNHPRLVLNGCAWLQRSGVVPANDNFAQAIDLGSDGSGVATAVGTNLLATHETNEPTHAGNAGARSVWWQFTALANGTATANTAGSNFDTLLAVYTGSAVDALTLVTSNDNDGANITSRVSFSVTAGVTYRIVVDGKNGATGHVGLALTMPRPPIPLNDNFASATVLGAGSVTATGDNLRATKETGEPNHAGNAGGKSVWWRWTASVTRGVTISTAGSDFNTTLGVYTGTAVNALTTIASNNDSGGVTSQVTFNAVANTIYRIAVDGFDGDAGQVALAVTVAPPSNDNFANSIALAGSAPTTTSSNVSATKENGEPNHAGNNGGSSVWWRWTAPANGYASVSTAGSTFDTLLAVYTGTAVNNLTLVASNDQANGGAQSQVAFAVTSGVIYRIAVDGSNNAQGSVALAINGTLPAPLASISTLDSSASERPLDPASFSVTLDPPQPQPITVSVNLGGAATAGVDYSIDTALNGNTASVTFAPLQTSRVVTLTPIADSDPTEFDESILATLNVGATYQISVGTAAAITLHDDTPYTAAWAQQFAPAFTGPAAQPLADFNSNGVANLLEFAFDGDPVAAGLVGVNGVPLLPVLGFGNYADPNDGNIVKIFPTLTLTQRTDAPALVYDVQTSFDLMPNSWDAAGAVQVAVSTDGMPPGTERVTYRSTKPAAGNGAVTTQFIHVSVTAP